MKRRRIQALWLGLALLAGGVWADQEYQPLKGAIPVRSTFSTGEHSIEQLARLAVAQGLQVLVFGDGHLLQVEYGIPLLRRLARFRQPHKALLSRVQLGAYLAEIRRVDALFPELILIDGVESTPFYYWEVDPGQRRWTVRQWDQRLLTVGLGSEAAYSRLPVSGSPSLRVWHWSSLLLLWPVFGLLYGWVARHVHPAWWRYAVVGFSGLCLVNNFPFKVDLWDAYSGDLGSAPYQYYLDYVAGRGGMAFWRRPVTGSTSGPQHFLGRWIEMAGDSLSTAKMLMQTRGYTGFSTFCQDPIAAAEPGSEWDQALRQYLHGRRERPVWAIGGNDACRNDAPADGNLRDPVQTVFLVREWGREGVLEAMRHGRMYATGGGGERLTLEAFSVTTEMDRVVAGEEALSRGAVRVQAALAKAGGREAEAEIVLIKGGTVIAQVRGRLPLEFGHLDFQIEPGERTYYRLMVDSRTAWLVSNPIFVTGSEP